MKNLLLFSLFFGLSITLLSQNINVAGVVADEKSGETMPGSTVMLLNPSDSSFYKFSSTNTEGKFAIKGIK